jgi:hypothetical protein
LTGQHHAVQPGDEAAGAAVAGEAVCAEQMRMRLLAAIFAAEPEEFTKTSDFFKKTLDQTRPRCQHTNQLV